MGRALRNKKRVDYHKVSHKYDKFSFKPSSQTLKIPKVKTGFAGRAASAPPQTTWPFVGIHADVDYFPDISDALWTAAALGDDVKLPFAWLDPTAADKWQGLVQDIALGGDAAARLHFDAVSARLATATTNPTITEAVGEAAAAMYMLAAGGWTMIWGFHLHAGTGIDQIWRQPIGGGGLYRYHIVEAKGPGAGLNPGIFVPPGYAQMERGWVVNHLQSMNANGHAAGTEIAAALGLTFNVAHPHYGGASKSYHGLATTGANAAGRLTGQVVTATWQADGRLGWNASAPIAYI